MNISEIIKLSSSFDQKDNNLIKNNGVIFTNKDICDKIIELVNPTINDIICEPSVGKGIFIFSLLEFFKRKYNISEIAHFVSNNLYCYDINNNFISEFKSLIKEYFGNIEIKLDNIICGDFLLYNRNYDIIIGNPPYVRIQNISKNYLNLLKSELKSVTLGNVDLYYAFLEKSLIHSKKIGFIIPNSFIKNKSGSFIRNIIKDRLTYIYDYKYKKVWNNISTYTSIVMCEQSYSKDMIYETSELKIIKDKSLLIDTGWIFEDSYIGSNKLINLVNSYSISLATIKDDAFKVDFFDDDYCYKNGFKIEKGICKKYIKATTSKKFEDYNYIIYPYINGIIIDEEKLKINYPNCYNYLLSRKNELISREGGNISKYDTWYAYGRKQGLLKNKIGRCLIIPLVFLKSRGIHYIEIPKDEECLVMSGIIIDLKEDMIDKFIQSISSFNFNKYCELNNKILPDKKDSEDMWLSVSTTTIKNYLY